MQFLNSHCEIFTAHNEVGKLGQGYIFTGVCDSVHREVLPPWGGAFSRGVSSGGGVLAPRGVVLPPGGVCLVETPPGQLLLRAVRILLECILVII